jgi:hypothetical protein
MNKKFSFAFSLLLGVFCMTMARAQNDSIKKYPTYRIGVFAPLYLDSVFNNNVFRYRQGIPKFIAPALDFVQGVQVALDSMPPGKDTIITTFYDSKAYENDIPWLIRNKKLDSLDILIGNVKDADFRQLADFALKRKIPFISATYPNDGGVTANPYLLIVNSTLRSHCEAIYSYLLQNHGTDKIFLCRKKGTQEDMVASYFKQMNELEGNALLDMHTLDLNRDSIALYLKTKLDSNRKSILIGGSLDEGFANKLTMACSSLYSSYPITLIGMPTWDGFNSLHKKTGLEEFPIYYTTSYFNLKSDTNSRILMNAFSLKFKGRPSDMAFRGYELISYFTSLLTHYPGDLMHHINDPSFRIFTDFNFKPVTLKKGDLRTDYYENKHLYLIKNLNGKLSEL